MAEIGNLLNIIHQLHLSKAKKKHTLARWSIMIYKGAQVLGNGGATFLKPIDLLSFLSPIFKSWLPAFSADFVRWAPNPPCGVIPCGVDPGPLVYSPDCFLLSLTLACCLLILGLNSTLAVVFPWTASTFSCIQVLEINFFTSME